MVSFILWLIAGLVMIVLGSDFLVNGASGIARKAGISEFVIGLTIVGFGTSCPELVVSLNGAIKGFSDIAIGNVIGSNIFNVLLILGVTALLMPIPVTNENRKRDIPLTIAITFLLVFSGMNKTLFNMGESDLISRTEGVIFLLIFAIYLYLCFKNDKHDQGLEANNDVTAEKPLWKSVSMTVLGLTALVFGGDKFVDSAVKIAGEIGISDKFIAVTVLAGGTSLPELATSIAAAAKKKGQLALGNILGSCVFNILLILGCSSLVTPLSFSGINLVDVSVLLLSSLLLLACSYTFKRNELDRKDGALLLLCFTAYYTWLFITL